MPKLVEFYSNAFGKIFVTRNKDGVAILVVEEFSEGKRIELPLYSELVINAKAIDL